MFHTSGISRRNSAFTLIELLIVVAIIAILAAIAVPNFLEAQVRAKVSRIRADQRSLATAMESYVVDWNKYPASLRTPSTARFGAATPTRAHLYSQLTTPVAFITSAFQDTFNVTDTNPENRVLVFWTKDTFGTVTGGDLYGAAEPINNNYNVAFRNFGEMVDLPYNTAAVLKTINTWALVSPGPDRVFGITTPTFPGTMDAYDPTNGTISTGDLVRFKQ